jgi:hypothetical protein
MMAMIKSPSALAVVARALLSVNKSVIPLLLVLTTFCRLCRRINNVSAFTIHGVTTHGNYKLGASCLSFPRILPVASSPASSSSRSDCTSTRCCSRHISRLKTSSSGSIEDGPVALASSPSSLSQQMQLKRGQHQQLNMDQQWKLQQKETA